MSPKARPYDHPARQLTDEDRASGVCTACNAPVIGTGPTLHHLTEAVRPNTPAPADAAAFAAAIVIAREALDRLPPWEVNDDDRARVIVEALHAAGALRTRRRSWHPPTLHPAA